LYQLKKVHLITI